ncbi:MAG: isochorismatase family protein [Prevotella sp.]|nr:isochorismatase family protein [Prevotella sp.]
MRKKLTLIVVDCQYDFIEGGSLAVEGGRKAIENVCELIASDRVGRLVFTQDWHPSGHCSFTPQGGPWPVHCVRGTHGARIHADLLAVAKEKNVYSEFLHKGKQADKEEYTAFTFRRQYADHLAYNVASATHRKPDVMVFAREEQVVVCGIAGDVCVLNTLRSLQPLRPRVFLAGVASLDGGQTLAGYMAGQGLKALG